MDTAPGPVPVYRAQKNLPLIPAVKTDSWNLSLRQHSDVHHHRTVGLVVVVVVVVAVAVVLTVCINDVFVDIIKQVHLLWGPCPNGHDPRPCTCVQGPKKSTPQLIKTSAPRPCR